MYQEWFLAEEAILSPYENGLRGSDKCVLELIIVLDLTAS
jgi:hypothetical protein